MEEGTTITPFEMVVLNQMSHYHLAMEAVKSVSHFHQLDDIPEIKNWKWLQQRENNTYL
ncbi:phosphoketolase [Pedobacter cryoconitis]|nr:phosphoketolase [Pedobacter cryoconitis]